MRAARLDQWLVLVAVVLACTFASKAGQNQEWRTSLKAVSWQVGEGQEVATIHGIAAEGFSLDVMGVEGPRAVRALLMPVGWTAEPNHEDAMLEFSIGRRQNSSGAHQVIDIEFGAALVELQPASEARIKELAPQMRQAALDVVSRKDVALSLPVPKLAKSFEAAVYEFVATKGDGEPLDAQAVITGATPQELYDALFSFWPMIITRSITAGAQGTDALVLALPDDDEHSFVCFSKFLGGSNFKMSSANVSTPIPTLNAGQHLRIEIVQEPNQPIEINPGNPQNTDPSLLAWAHDVLCEGWKQVFEEQDCPSQGAVEAHGAENNGP
ncbi:MAG: hypothetical protein RIC94_08430 [Phycisphaerales bacterium]|jgi:hypothetical protein